MPSESIPEDERLALARALRHVSDEDTPRRTPENQEEIARLFGDEAAAGPAAEAEDEPSGPRLRVLHVLIGLLALACLALVVPLAMDFLGGEDSGEVPVIQADQRPDKVRPEEPGGLQVPHQDLQVLNQGAAEGAAEPVERLLPPPETPEPLPQATQEAALPEAWPAPSADSLAAPPAADETTAATVAPPGAPPGGADAVLAPAVPAPAEVTPPRLEAAEVPPATTRATAQAQATPQAPASNQAQVPVPAAERQQAALPPAAETRPAAGDSGIYIQLGSLSKREGVSQEWARLQKAFPDFLGDMELAVQTVTLEGRGTFHRIQAGPLPNRGTAEEMCAFLKNAEQACIVVRR